MSIHLDTLVQFVKGVGPSLGDYLHRRGIFRVHDLLAVYPRAYEDRRRARNIASLVPDETVSLKAQIVQIKTYRLGARGKKITDILLKDESGQIHAKYFRTPFRGYFDRFSPGLIVQVIGKVHRFRTELEFMHPDIKEFSQDLMAEEELIPLYPETDGLSNRKMGRLIKSAISGLNEIKSEIKDPLPLWLRQKFTLVERYLALEKIHIPPSKAGSQFIHLETPFHRRIIFDEFFALELHLALRKKGVSLETPVAMLEKLGLIEKLKSQIPFQLTKDQLKAIQEIILDLVKPYPMHRLVQGDVGSGKTIVAFAAAALAIENGHQVAMMVPTEILAGQHFKVAGDLFGRLGIGVALLSSRINIRDKKQTLEDLQTGKVQLVIGTQALIQKGVEFKSLGLVIVDEQHRFGVVQRGDLKRKGKSPHFLLMTATPIPRSLALTLYGDLDISIIAEKPPGRVPVTTRIARAKDREKVFGFLKEQIGKGRQAYFVYALVEESEKNDLKNAQEEYEFIKSEFPQYNVGLMHGRMKSEEKEEIMNQFRGGEIQILVSTTVIEVGVDVANANLMIIENPERFGLSQLHQLRGRVGRGKHKSFCILLTDKFLSKEAYERLRWMEKTSDGFKLAEADLEIRGPGELMGRRQSGLPGFRMADLVRDYKILVEAKAAAFEFVETEPLAAAKLDETDDLLG